MTAHAILFSSLVGSRAYGTHTENSDWDLRTVVLGPRSHYFGLEPFPKTRRVAAGPDQDVLDIELKHFMSQLVKGGPNAVEMLFSPDVRVLHPAFMEIWSNREMFLTKTLMRSLLWYARSMLESKGSRKEKDWMQGTRVLLMVVSFLETGKFEVRQREDRCGYLRHIRQYGLWSTPREILREQCSLRLEGHDTWGLPDYPDSAAVNAMIERALLSIHK